MSLKAVQRSLRAMESCHGRNGIDLSKEIAELRGVLQLFGERATASTGNLAKSQADAIYESGWNSALEMAAFKLTHDFKTAFGADTLASIAAYIKGLKK